MGLGIWPLLYMLYTMVSSIFLNTSGHKVLTTFPGRWGWLGVVLPFPLPLDSCMDVDRQVWASYAVLSRGPGCFTHDKTYCPPPLWLRLGKG